MTKVRTSQLAQTGATTNQGLVWNGTSWLPANIVLQSLVDAKGDLLVGTADNAVGRLAVGGTNGHILVVDSTAATGIKWAVLDDTTKISKALLTATGDMVIAGAPGIPSTLPVGAIGQLLGIIAGKPAWVDAPSPTAAQVPFTPFGTIEATNVQGALEELSLEGGSGGGGGGAGGGHIIEDEGVALAQRANLNFVGPGVLVSDDPTNGETRVEITGSPAATSTFTRQSATYTTAALATDAHELALLTLAPGYRLYTITTNRPARVRLYENATKQDSDLLRGRGVEPVANSGLMFDYVTAQGALSATLSPLVDGYVHTGSNAALTVTNLSSSGTVTVTLTYVRTE